MQTLRLAFNLALCLAIGSIVQLAPSGGARVARADAGGPS